MTGTAAATTNDATSAALACAFDVLGDVRPVGELESLTSPLSLAERATIVDQAILLLEGLYVHLHLKRVRHAVDPVQALKVLAGQVSKFSDFQFHGEMLRIFNSLKDIHTAYTAPPPYAGRAAFLPFLMEPCVGAGGRRRYVVTRVLKGFDHPTFRSGVEIVRWHGAPVQHAVERNAVREAGANPAAHLALGNLFMTVRWLGACLPPDEDWVIIGYRHADGEAEIRLPWSMLPIDDPTLVFAIQAVWEFDEDTQAGENRLELNQALNLRTHLEHQTRRRLFAPDQAPQTAELASKLPTLFSAERLRDAKGEIFGYVRIRAFQHDDVPGFIGEFRRLLSLMPRRGLVIDIRGNPGGIVQAAESLLQFMTPKSITPVPFQFAGTDLVAALCAPADAVAGSVGAFFERKAIASHWGASLSTARATGTPFTGGFPLTTAEEANCFGQLYFGPVVLVTDAITYSAGDIFAAGFQDHGIGPVLGIDATTGAGGANVWGHDHLVELLPDRPGLVPLPPGGAKLRVAARVCNRTGTMAGQPIEELGIVADERHALSEADITAGNRDLKAAAMAMLARQPARWLEVKSSDSGDAVLMTPTNLDRLDVYLEDRPLGSFDVQGDVPLKVAVPAGWPSSRIEVRGFTGGALVACRRLETVTG